MSLREFQRLAGKVLWRWGVGCLVVSIVPLFLQALVMIFSHKWPANFVEFVLWPSVPAVGIISCTMTVFDILNMRGRILFRLDRKKRVTSKLRTSIDKLDNFKKWAFLFVILGVVEAGLYVILLLNKYEFEIQSNIVALFSLISIILIVGFSLGAQCYITSLVLKSKGVGG